jgi:hypothetical protein
MALGEVGLEIGYFESLEWREWLLIYEGYSLRYYKQLEQTRMISYTIAAANRDPKKPFPSIHRFMPLPTDVKEDKGEKISKEELAKIVKLYNNL